MTFHSDGTLACICHEHRPQCDCVVADAPSLAPQPLSAIQLRFLALHAHPSDLVQRWTWHFCETMLRAISDRGRCAYVWRDELRELVEAGLMEEAGGVSVRVTPLGKQYVVEHSAPQRLKGSTILENGDAT